VVVLTKADLGADAGEATSAVPEVEVVVTSTTTGQGIDVLATLCHDRTVVLLGESGAGKSTLTNALAGRDAAAVGAVRESDNKGRHTTTTRELYLLDKGGVVIDSPGVRAYALWGDEEAVDAAFPDIEELAASCRFSDCGHDSEPGCAVRGSVDDERLDRWRELRQEIGTRARDHDRRPRRRPG
jgi:ribosome biogenesis GTPase